MRKIKSFLTVALVCVLLALPLALTGCGDGALSEDEWMGVFSETNFENCTLEANMFTEVLGAKIETMNMLVKTDGNKGYVKVSMPIATDLFDGDIEVYARTDGNTAYTYSYDEETKKWYRYEQDLKDLDIGFALGDYDKIFVDVFSSFKYDKKQDVYTAENLEIGSGETKQVFSSATVKIEEGRVTNMTYTQSVSSSATGVTIETPVTYELKFYNYGTTAVEIPTEYEEVVIGPQVNERQWKKALSAEAFEGATTELDDLTRITALADSYGKFVYDSKLSVYFSNNFNGYDQAVLTFDGGRLVKAEFTSTDDSTSEQIIETFTFVY